MTADTAVRARATQDVADAVKDAAARRTPLRVVGRGHWLDAGAPASPATPLALDALSGIVAYTPGDLTLTVRAGTTLSDIAAVTAEHGQWLALDPFGTDDGTIGATIATASAGPLAHAFGTPRDAALGLEVVTGDGSIIRTGGRVVKNVAGFDLTRLFTGSWGTLGVITEVTVRLRARPDVDETWVVALAEDDAIGAACRAALGAAAACSAPPPWAHPTSGSDSALPNHQAARSSACRSCPTASPTRGRSPPVAHHPPGAMQHRAAASSA